MAGKTSVSETFSSDGIDGSIRFEYDPEPMFPGHSGTGEITLSYDDIQIRATSRDGRRPVVSFSSDDWGRCLDRVRPTDSLIYRPIPDTKVEEIEEVSSAVEKELGHVEVMLGPEATTECEAIVDEAIPYEVSRSAYGSEVKGSASSYEMFADVVTQFDERLEPVVDSGFVQNGWSYVMPEAYDD